MKISILSQKFKRINNQTCCIILACIKDNNGVIIRMGYSNDLGNHIKNLLEQQNVAQKINMILILVKNFL